MRTGNQFNIFWACDIYFQWAWNRILKIRGTQKAHLPRPGAFHNRNGTALGGAKQSTYPFILGRPSWIQMATGTFPQLNHFYTPVRETDIICSGNVRPSSVRVFRTFFSTCFEIPILKLVYTFSGWHDMSSLSCITIGSLWPSLQPKIGQNHGLRNQDKFFKFGIKVACCILLYITSVFCANVIFGILAIICVRFGFCEVFRAFFCFEISIWNLVYIYICSRWCYTSSSSFIPIMTLWPTLQPKIGCRVKVCILVLKFVLLALDTLKS